MTKNLILANSFAYLPKLSTLLGLPLVAALTMSSCVSTGGINHKQTLSQPVALGARAKFDAWPSEQWWQIMQDPALNHLIDLALKDNPNIVQAATRLDKATAYVGYAKSALSVQVTGAAEVSHQRLSENAFYPPPYGGTYQNIVNATLNASWDLDFWGKNHSALQAVLSQTEAAKAEKAAAKLLVSTVVAQTYYQLARQVEQQQLAYEALEQRKQELKLIKTRIDTGLDTNLELELGQGNIYSAKVGVEVATEAVNLTRNALAALTVQKPQALDALQPRLPTFNAQALPDDIPIDLISRRPDLAAAKAVVNGASADINSAKAEFYPNVSLSAFIGLSSFGLSKFLEMGSTVVGAGPALHLPIFDAGRLRANLQSKNADLDIAIAGYNAVLLQAINDVADKMTSVKSVRRAFGDQQAALYAAESAYRLANIRYEAGLTNYLNVLTEKDTLLRERSRLINLQARSLELNIALIKSLGGGFNWQPSENSAQLDAPK